MAYKGRVQNGVIVLDETISLSEGTPVQVELAGPQNVKTPENTLKEFIEHVDDLPSGIPQAQQPSASLFGVMVRTVGLISLLVGCLSLLVGLLTIGGGSIIIGALMLGIGLWLLRGADTLVEFAYYHKGPGKS